MDLNFAASLLNETMLLTEDVNSTATKKSKNLIRQRFKTSIYGINMEDVETNQNGARDEHDRTWLENLEYRFRNEIILKCGVDTREHRDAQKFEPGLLRIAMDSCNWPKMNKQNTELLAALNGILFMHHKNDYDMELTGQTLASLKEIFADEIPDEIARQNGIVPIVVRNERGWNGILLNRNDYTVLSIDTYEQSHEFQRWTGLNGESTPWCLTGARGTYNSYASNGTRIYFTYIRNYQQIFPITSYNAYDAYGLSLMCVQVASNGKLLYCTSRYNHNATGYNLPNTNHNSDRIMNEKELCKVFGINSLSEMFPPYSDEELRRKGVIIQKLNQFTETLDAPENANKDPYEIFVNDGRIFHHYNNIPDLAIGNNGILRVNVSINNSPTIFYVNKDKKILCDRFFKSGLPFKYNYTIASIEHNEHVIIDTKGNIVSKFNVNYMSPSKVYDYLVAITFDSQKQNVFNLKSGKFLFKNAHNYIDLLSINNNSKFIKVIDIINYKQYEKLFDYKGKEITATATIDTAENELGYKKLIQTNHKFIIGIRAHGYKIDIINTETGEVIPTQFHICNSLFERTRYGYYNFLYKFNNENIAEIAIDDHNQYKIILLKTDGTQYGNKSWPLGDEKSYGDNDATFDHTAQGLTNAYIVKQNSDRNGMLIIDKDGNRLLPGPAKTNLVLQYNTAINVLRHSVRRGDYDKIIYSLKNPDDVLYALNASNAIIDGDGHANDYLFARYLRLDFRDSVLQPNGERYYNSGIYDTLENEFIIKPSTQERTSFTINHCYFIQRPFAKENDRYLYINYCGGLMRNNIFDLKRKEFIFNNNDQWTTLLITYYYDFISSGYPGILFLRNNDNEGNVSYNFVKLDTEGYLVDGGFNKLLQPFNEDGIAKILKNREYYINIYGDISTRIENIEESTKYKNSKYLLQASYLIE